MTTHSKSSIKVPKKPWMDDPSLSDEERASANKCMEGIQFAFKKAKYREGIPLSEMTKLFKDTVLDASKAKVDPGYQSTVSRAYQYLRASMQIAFLDGRFFGQKGKTIVAEVDDEHRLIHSRLYNFHRVMYWELNLMWDQPRKIKVQKKCEKNEPMM